MAQTVLCPTPTAQSNFFTGSSWVTPTILVRGGSMQLSAIAPTILVDSLTHQETKQAYDEVSSTFKEMSDKHKQIQKGLHVLASMVEALRQEK